jgi:PTS hybrid protein
MTVGIVLVSHSRELAAGLRALAQQVAGDHAAVEVAGGTDDGALGTSYALIRAAIGRADQGAGVVILPDLGSSVLTARVVLDDHPRTDVLMVDGPFVEGAVAAAAIAAAGGDLAAVAAAAREARDVAKF